jgi:hypothetical protein
MVRAGVVLVMLSTPPASAGRKPLASTVLISEAGHGRALGKTEGHAV